jgi:hypothetical protein
MSNDLVPNNRGFGTWELEVYSPPSKLFRKKGYLFIAKDHHTIFEDSNLRKTLLNIPSQNVAWVEIIEENEDEF